MSRLISAPTLLVLLVGAFLATSASAETICVCWDGSGDYLTIQEGIDGAADGDAVVVCEGTYTGEANRELDFYGKAITVRSLNGPAVTIIECEGAGRGLRFNSGEGPGSVVDGFTIINGCPGGYNDGGGVYCYASSPTISDCRIIDCSADEGGGIYCTDYSSPTIIDCVVSGNAATGQYGPGGGIFSYLGSPTIANCAICGNAAGRNGGGGLRLRYGAATITNCVIAGNTTSGDYAYGGGIYAKDTSATIANCTIVGNSADTGGGGIYCLGYGDLSIVNCTIVGNSSSHGGGISAQAHAEPVVVNCILWGDTAAVGPEIDVGYGSLHPVSMTVSHSDVAGGQAAVYVVDWGTLIWGDGNIDADPLFVDPDGIDGDPNSWEDNDYHLGLGSPCVDAGDPTFIADPDDRDIDGQWRVWDGDDDGDWRVDMGSDEFASHCPGDLNGDGQIGLADLAGLLANYGATNGMTPADGDADLDGDVDLSDLAALLAVYGTSCD